MHIQWPPQGAAARDYMMRTAPLAPWMMMYTWTQYSYRAFYAGMMMPMSLTMLALKSFEQSYGAADKYRGRDPE